MQLDPAVAKTRPSNFSPVVLRMLGFTSDAGLGSCWTDSAALPQTNVSGFRMVQCRPRSTETVTETRALNFDRKRTISDPSPVRVGKGL